MGLQFNPPNWLIEEYYNRRNPVEGLADTLRGISKDVLEQRQANRRDRLTEQEMANRQEQNRLAGEQVRQTGIKNFDENGNPLVLPGDLQQVALNPTQGPVTSAGVPPADSPLKTWITQRVEEKKNERALAMRSAENKLQPNSLDEILAQQVRDGQITIEKAYEVKAKGSPSSNVKLPLGYMWMPDGSMAPIPGGPAATKIDEKEQKEKALTDASITQANTVLAKVDQALRGTSGWSSGFFGSLTKGIPGTPAKNLAADIQTIKANLGFAQLQEMRRNSPTGGALGQVAVQELEALQSTVASLDQEQSPDQLIERLKEIKTHYEKWKDAVTRSQSGGGTNVPPPAGGPQRSDPLGIR